MTITFNSIILCAGDHAAEPGDPVGPDRFRVRLAPGTEEHDYIGAAGVDSEHVGCDALGVSFAVARTYATVAAAQAAAVGMKAAAPREGVVAIDGAAFIAKATLRDMNVQQVGCTLFVDYEIEGF